MSQPNTAKRIRTLDFLSSKNVASVLVEDTRAFGNAAAKVSLQRATEAFSEAAEKLSRTEAQSLQPAFGQEKKE